jgi:cardiolipin synthase
MHTVCRKTWQRIAVGEGSFSRILSVGRSSKAVPKIGDRAVFEYWPHVTILGTLNVLALVVVIPYVLLTKKEPATAVAWVLLVLLVPLLGSMIFWLFGYNYLLSRVKRQRRQRPLLRERQAKARAAVADEPAEEQELASLARRYLAFPARGGNAVTLYHETSEAYAALLTAIEAAKHHIHLEFFIFRSDETGLRLLEQLTRKAKEGVQVRFLYDAMGSVHLRQRALGPLRSAGGQVFAFLPINPLRSRIQINLRNHRKIMVTDGHVAFTGGMNIGDDYLGRSPRFSYWRDTFMRVEGEAASDLQRIFCEDWDFAVHETLDQEEYYPAGSEAGSDVVQVAASGPDQEVNTIRELYFIAFLAARERLWVASPYTIPDAGLTDALRLARRRGVDVRILTISRPDHFVSFYAGRSYWSDLLSMGVKIYLYTKGMMHSKLVLVDGKFASVGSANLDNRSLHLNFEAGCLLYNSSRVAELEAAFLRDLEESRPLLASEYERRSPLARAAENACRLVSPIL